MANTDGQGVKCKASCCFRPYLSPSLVSPPPPSRFSSWSIGNTSNLLQGVNQHFFRAYDRNARKWKGTSTLWSASLALDPVITSNQMYSKDAKSAAGASRQHSEGPCRHVEVATKAKRDFSFFFFLLLICFFFFVFLLDFLSTRTQRAHG